MNFKLNNYDKNKSELNSFINFILYKKNFLQHYVLAVDLKRICYRALVIIVLLIYLVQLGRLIMCSHYYS